MPKLSFPQLLAVVLAVMLGANAALSFQDAARRGKKGPPLPADNKIQPLTGPRPTPFPKSKPSQTANTKPTSRTLVQDIGLGRTQTTNRQQSGRSASNQTRLTPDRPRLRRAPDRDVEERPRTLRNEPSIIPGNNLRSTSPQQPPAPARKGKKGTTSTGEQVSMITPPARRTPPPPANNKRESQPSEDESKDAAAPVVVVPDRIEVFEYGDSSPALLGLIDLPPAKPTSSGTGATRNPAPPKLQPNITIETERIYEIQLALTSQGYYNGELTGQYDEATIDAMWRFQQANQIAATGYPTAHSLKRLGLTNW